MKNEILCLNVISSQDLEEQLSALSAQEKKNYRFVSLSVSGANVLVSPFSVTRVSMNKLTQQLRLDAVDMLSLPATEIVVDYQILKASKEEIKGVMTCVGEDYLTDLQTIIKDHKFIPLKIVPKALVILNAFFSKHTPPKGRFCLLDFTSTTCVNLAVFDDQQCELVREVPYETLQEVKSEVVQSLRSASAKSSNKNIDRIYFVGEQDEVKVQMMEEFAEVFSNETAYLIDVSIHDGLYDNAIWGINLLRNKSCSLKQRQVLLSSVHLILILMCVGVAILGLKMKEKSQTLNALELESTQDKTVDYVKSGERQLSMLSN